MPDEKLLQQIKSDFSKIKDKQMVLEYISDRLDVQAQTECNQERASAHVSAKV